MSWLSKLKSALGKTSDKLQSGIVNIFTKKKLDNAMLEQLEDLLIESDMGVAAASELVESLRQQRFGKEVTPDEVKEVLAAEMTGMLSPLARPFEVNPSLKPHVVLVVGVNGNGKTTTIGKLAHQFTRGGHKVMLAAADTFRAAAVEQLEVWAQRSKLSLIKAEANADPASVAYRALEEARREQADILLIDTAGRLQNKSNLMAELQKITKVIQKIDPAAPHSVLQVLDATTGQNALNQVEVFREMIGVTGLIVTKLDGTAKGGVIVALAQKFQLPIHAIGIGEGIEDLDSFEAADFTANLVGMRGRDADAA